MTSRTRKSLRLAPPAALILLGAALLNGCIFIPTFNNTVRDKDVSGQVGPSKSRKPLRLHAATRDDVIRLLGQPHYASPDRTRIMYTWAVRNGVWIWPLCFAAYDQQGSRGLLLTFDDAGILRTSEVLKADGNFMNPRESNYGMIPEDMSPRALGAVRPTPATRPVLIRPPGAQEKGQAK